MKRKYIFLFIAIIGVAYTWYYNIQYFSSYEEASLIHFFELAQSNFAGKSFGADLSAGSYVVKAVSAVGTYQTQVIKK